MHLERERTANDLRAELRGEKEKYSSFVRAESRVKAQCATLQRELESARRELEQEQARHMDEREAWRRQVATLERRVSAHEKSLAREINRHRHSSFQSVMNNLHREVSEKILRSKDCMRQWISWREKQALRTSVALVKPSVSRVPAVRMKLVVR